MELTEKERQKADQEIFEKIVNILKVNGIDCFRLDSKLISALVMLYQQGVKDAKELLTLKD